MRNERWPDGLPDEYYKFLVMRIFPGWTEAQYEAANATFCDQALMFTSIEAKVTRDKG